jgi:cytochrome c-type biogenesis protein CcmE
MKPRQRRLLWVLAGLALVAVAVTLVLRALNSNVMFFYSPSQVHAGEVPHGAAFRLGAWWSLAHCSAAATECCCALP